MLRRLWHAFDDRIGLTSTIVPIITHPVPPGTGWMYVFGSATLFAFLVQVVTGVALVTAYIPATGNAYQALQFITDRAIFGRVLRGMHYFGASAMIVLIGIHTIRVFLTGAYKFPRELNWLTGAFLMPLTLLMGFTGQLLRWDQNGIWSVIVGAEQAARAPLVGHAMAGLLLGGDTVGGATLTRFFAVHVFLIPAGIFAFLGAHLYLVLRHGISEPPVAGRPVDPKTYRSWYERLLKEHGHPFWPDAAWRDVVFGAMVVLVIVALAIVVGPPQLGKQPDPTIIEAYPRPDWYLLWYFALLALIPSGIESYVIVLAPVIGGLLFLTLPFLSNAGERSPLRRPWAMGVVVAALLMIGTLWRAGAIASWSPDFAAPLLPESIAGATGGPAADGARLFHDKGCEYCHTIGPFGGHRGPDLTWVAERLTPADLTIRIANGGTNMPAFAGYLSPEDLRKLLAFMSTRRRPGTSLAGREEAGPLSRPQQP
jgi:ubiquinol-cytochrome c reductase cytochrome b subunit